MASAIDPLLPPEIFNDEPPLTDEELAAYFETLDTAEYDTGHEMGDLVGVSDVALDRHRANRWEIDGPNTAAWAMAKFAEAEAAIAELSMQKQEYVTRIAHWFDNSAKSHQRSLEFFAGHLTRYAVERRLATDGKEKSIKTPSGIVKTTATARAIEIEDPDEVVTWAIEHAAEIVKHRAPVVNVTDVRTVVALVDVPTKVVLSPCACVVAPTIPHDLKVWQLGNGVTCPACNQDALVGRWLETMPVVVDESGDLVPGLVVRNGTISAKVVTS